VARGRFGLRGWGQGNGDGEGSVARWLFWFEATRVGLRASSGSARG